MRRRTRTLYYYSEFGHDKSQAILQYRRLASPPTLFFFGDGVSGEYPKIYFRVRISKSLLCLMRLNLQKKTFTFTFTWKTQIFPLPNMQICYSWKRKPMEKMILQCIAREKESSTSCLINSQVSYRSWIRLWKEPKPFKKSSRSLEYDIGLRTRRAGETGFRALRNRAPQSARS